MLVIIVVLAEFVLWSNDYISTRDKVDKALTSSISEATVDVQLKIKEREKVIEAKSLPFYAVSLRSPENQFLMMQG